MVILHDASSYLVEESAQRSADMLFDPRLAVLTSSPKKRAGLEAYASLLAAFSSTFANLTPG